MSNRSTIIYKRKANESLVVPYNTVLLSTWKANMNIQYVTGMYGVITYLTSYLCKSENYMSELMKAASKEASAKAIRDKLFKIGNVFQKCREVSTHKAIARTISLPLRHSNIDVQYVSTGLKENITRMLKPKIATDRIDDPDSTDVYIPNILDKYIKRPDSLEEICLADFSSEYRNESIHNPSVDDETIESYSQSISDYVDTPESSIKIDLKDGLGKMRKRSRPCVIRWHKTSKLKDPEEYYLKLLQLYLPWRDESELRHANGTYESKFAHVQHQIQEVIQKHQSYEDIDLDDLKNNLDTDSDDDGNESDEIEYMSLRPGILDISDESDNDLTSTNNCSSVTTVNNTMHSNDQFYDMCAELNAKQRSLLNKLMKHIQMLKWSEQEPKPFYIFLSGGGGVGKSYFIKTMSDYAKRYLKYTGQSLNQPSIMLTASTGKAATNINGLTVHKAFNLITDKLSRRTLSALQLKYRYLKIIILDEISMIGFGTFKKLDLHLQDIMECHEPFGGISILAVGDFLQLPPVAQTPIFTFPNNRTYDAFKGCNWELFQLYELTEIVRQSSDPKFASILSRIREGKQTQEDECEIEKLNNTDMSSWDHDFIRLYSMNKEACVANNELLETLSHHKYLIKAKDSRLVNEDVALKYTGNLPSNIKICIDARFMLTINLDTEDHLINGSIGTIKYIHMDEANPLNGTIYIQFDDPDSGNKRKRKRPNKEWVPIVAEVRTFYLNGHNTQRKQFPGILAHAVTIHKSQGSTYQYMHGNISRDFNKPGMAYTMLSRAKNRSGIKLNNFTSRMIKTNRQALNEMDRMHEESLLDISHPLLQMETPVILLLNIRSWNSHIHHMLKDPIYLNLCSILCFTETKVENEYNIKRINQFDSNWDDIHFSTDHGLTICFQKNRMKLLCELTTNPSIEAVAIKFQYQQSEFILILIYRKPGAILNFVQQLTEQIRTFRQSHSCRIILLGDFNIDQRSDHNVNQFSAMKQEFLMQQKSTFTTHIDGGILDLVFDTNSSLNQVLWLPTPFSDHYMLFYTI